MRIIISNYLNIAFFFWTSPVTIYVNSLGYQLHRLFYSDISKLSTRANTVFTRRGERRIMTRRCMKQK